MTTAKSFGLIALVAACGLIAGWFLLGLGDSGDSQGEARTGAAEHSVPSLSGTPGNHDEARGALPEAEAIDTIGSTPFEAESEAAGNYAFAIQVLGPDDQPVLGAAVEVIDWASSRNTFFSQASSAKIIILREKTDSKGFVYLKRNPKTGLKAVARKGIFEGQLVVASDAFVRGGSGSIKLQPRRQVIASVRDASGAPVPNAAVNMQGFAFNSISGYGWTNADGEAMFEVSPLDRACYDRKQFHVRVVLQSGVQKSEPVSWAMEGPTRVDVTLNKIGTMLVVKVLREDGQLDPSEHTISWESNEMLGSSEGMIIIDSLPGAKKPVSRTRTFSGGEIAFAGFSPGAEISLTLETRGRVLVKKDIVLPVHAALTHEVELTRGEKAPVVIIPVTNQKGESLAGKKFAVTVKRSLAKTNRRMIFAIDGMDGEREVMTVDSAGNIQLELDVGRTTEVVFREALRAVIWGGGNEALAVVKVQPLVAGETRTLDPAVIPEAPILVAGQVVNSEGEPEGGVLVRVMKFPGKGEHFDWNISNRLHSLSARTGADGKFELRSRVKTEGLNLLAMKSPAEQSEATPFDQGDADLQVILHASGGIAVKVARDLPDQRLKIDCSLSSGADADTVGIFAQDLKKSKWLRADQTEHEFKNLMPGVYDVKFVVGGVSVLKVEKVVVRPGEVAQDSRLIGVTPDKGWMVGSVTVRGPDSQPIKDAKVTFELPGDELGRQGGRQKLSDETNASGIAERICRIGTICDLSVRSNGYLPFSQKQVPLPADVTLSRGASLRVLVDAGGPFPESDRIQAWEVSLRKQTKTKPKSDKNPGGGGFSHERGASLVVSETLSGPTSVSFSGAAFSRATASLSTKLSAEGEGTIRGIPEGEYDVHIKSISPIRMSGNGGHFLMTTLLGSGQDSSLKIGEATFPKGASGQQIGQYRVTQKWLLEQVSKAEGKDKK